MPYKIQNKDITEFLENSHCFFHPNAHSKICSTETNLLNLPEPLKIVECSECQLKFLNPRINQIGYNLLYKEDYYTKGSGAAGDPYKDYASEKMIYFTSKWKFLESIYPQKGSVLDIGASMGHFLKIGEDFGWKVSGLDLSQWAADYAKETFNINIFVGTLENYISNNNDEKFDVITSFHTLEHLSNPLEAVELMSSLLKPGGLIMLEVPNQFNDIFVKLTLPYQKFKAKQANPTIVHTYFFNVEILKKLVEQCGFKIVNLTTWRKGYPIYGKNKYSRYLKKSLYTFGNLFQKGDIIEITARKIK